jgi:hypothetical protein
MHALPMCATLEARCQKLSEALEATTFRLAKTEAEARDRMVLDTQLDAAIQRLVDALEPKRLPAKSATPTLKRLLAQVNAMREVVHRPRRKKRSPPARPRSKASRARRARPPPAVCGRPLQRKRLLHKVLA